MCGAESLLHKGALGLNGYTESPSYQVCCIVQSEVRAYEAVSWQDKMVHSRVRGGLAGCKSVYPPSMTL